MRMKRRLIVLIAMVALLLPALPLNAGTTNINPPGFTCWDAGKRVHLRFTVAAGSSTVKTLSTFVGRAQDPFYLSPSGNWIVNNRAVSVPAGSTYTTTTGYVKVFSTRAGGGLSTITLSSLAGQPAPTFSWIGWVCI